jgi:excisionase family DNA binding protein
VAEVLGVSEATVKRWADAGTLRCFRTPGGHRKFRLRDIKAFLADSEQGGLLEDRDIPASGAHVTAGVGLTPEQVQVRALALASDVDGLVSLVANHRLEGLSVARICDGLIAPVMRELGEAWMAGRLSPAQEHIASNTVKDMLARVRPLVERNAKVDRGRALCACLGKEQHDLGVRMVGLILASEGYRSVMAGANVPATDLAMMASSEPPEVLALSASPHSEKERLRGDLAIVASALSGTRTRIVVGGDGFARLPQLPSNVRRFATLEELVQLALQGAPERAPAVAAVR